jgi:hypothetical protein
MTVKNGITYGTSNQRVVNILEHYRNSNTRIRIHFGDPTTGKLWGDTEIGYVRNSIGPEVKVPIIVHNTTSIGGSVINTDNIVRIEFANKKDGDVIFEARPLAFEVVNFESVAAFVD